MLNNIRSNLPNTNLKASQDRTRFNHSYLSNIFYSQEDKSYSLPTLPKDITKMSSSEDTSSVVLEEDMVQSSSGEVTGTIEEKTSSAERQQSLTSIVKDNLQSERSDSNIEESGENAKPFEQLEKINVSNSSASDEDLQTDDDAKTNYITKSDENETISEKSIIISEMPKHLDDGIPAETNVASIEKEVAKVEQEKSEVGVTDVKLDLEVSEELHPENESINEQKIAEVKLTSEDQFISPNQLDQKTSNAEPREADIGTNNKTDPDKDIPNKEELNTTKIVEDPIEGELVGDKTTVNSLEKITVDSDMIDLAVPQNPIEKGPTSPKENIEFSLQKYETPAEKPIETDSNINAEKEHISERQYGTTNEKAKEAETGTNNKADQDTETQRVEAINSAEIEAPIEVELVGDTSPVNPLEKVTVYSDMIDIPAPQAAIEIDTPLIKEVVDVSSKQYETTDRKSLEIYHNKNAGKDAISEEKDGSKEVVAAEAVNIDTKEAQREALSSQETAILANDTTSAKAEEDKTEETINEISGRLESSDQTEQISEDFNSASGVVTQLDTRSKSIVMETLDAPIPILQETETPVDKEIVNEKEKVEIDKEVINEDTNDNEDKEPKPTANDSPLVEYGSVGTGSYGITYCYKKVSEWFGK